MRSRLVRFAGAVALVAALGAIAPFSQAAPRPASRGRLLLLNFSLGFHHLSIPHGTQVLAAALGGQGYDVTVSSDPASLTPARLASTDAVVWLNTTGSGAAPFSARTKRAFEDWMRCGGGNVGIHAMAGPLFTGWPAWTRMWGSTEGGEPLTETSVVDDDTARYEGWGQFDVTVKVDDHRSPATVPWHGVTAFNARDEWYHWASDPSKVVPDFHQLLGFDGFTDPRTAAQYSGAGYWWDMPVAFTGSFEHTNRDFYTNLGHSTTMFDDPDYVTHVLGGTDWVTQVRPDAGCLARHGMRGPERPARPTFAGPGDVQVLAPKPTSVAQAQCFLVAQASPTGKSLYGGLGLCNGQLDVACSLGVAGPPEVPGGGCSDPAHATAGVEAGEQYVDPRTDLRYTEPPLSVSGSCASGTFSGLAFVTWRDQRLSVLSISATGGVVTGSVLRSVVLRPVSKGGRPLTVRSTELVGGTVSGVLALPGCGAPASGPSVPFFGGVSAGTVTGSLAVTA